MEKSLNVIGRLLFIRSYNTRCLYKSDTFIMLFILNSGSVWCRYFVLYITLIARFCILNNLYILFEFPHDGCVSKQSIMT